MIRRQPLVPTNEKQYAVISDFSNGYDINTADGVIDDNTFRDMLNCISDENGRLRKRNGHSLAALQELIEYYIPTGNDANYNVPALQTIINEFSGEVNGVAVSEGYYRDTLIKELIYMKGHSYGTYVPSSSLGNKSTFNTVLNITTLSDSITFNEITGLPGVGETEFIVVLGGKIDGYEDIQGTGLYLEDYSVPTIKVIHVKITSENYYSGAASDWITKFSVNYNIYYDDVAYTSMQYKLADEISESGELNIEQFNDNLYFTTGYNFFKIDGDGELSAISSSNAFKPSVIEATNVGFNILADSPLTWLDYNSTSTVNVIRGVFFTKDIGGSNFEPIFKIPKGSEFVINVIDTGTGALGTPQYRLDNGEVDDTINPWIDFDGSYTGSLFTVTSFDLDGNFEMKITKTGGEAYRGYFTTGSSIVPEVGRVSDIKDLVTSSLYCKVIGSQLVLYGGHGYLFFSDYSNFSYFPNYYNIYAVNSSDDEVTSLSYFRQYYAVFTKKLIKRLSGTFGADDFGLFKLNDFVGCKNPNTIKQVQNNLFFISDGGLYRLKQGYTGEGTENVEQIDITIEGDYDITDIKNAVVFDTRYIMSTENGVIYYDFKQEAFYKYINGISYDGDTVIYSPLYLNNQNISVAFTGQIKNGDIILTDYKTYVKAYVDNHRLWLLDNNVYSETNEALLLSIVAQANTDIDADTTEEDVDATAATAIVSLNNVDTGLG